MSRFSRTAHEAFMICSSHCQVYITSFTPQDSPLPHTPATINYLEFPLYPRVSGWRCFWIIFSEDTKLVSNTFWAPMCQWLFMCLCPLPPPHQDYMLFESRNIFTVIFVSQESILVHGNVRWMNNECMNGTRWQWHSAKNKSHVDVRWEMVNYFGQRCGKSSEKSLPHLPEYPTLLNPVTHRTERSLGAGWQAGHMQ